MKFVIHGDMSNGNGLFDFCRYQADKMIKLKEDLYSFIVMNLFILKLLETCYFSNSTQRYFHVTYEDMNRDLPSLTLNKFSRILKNLNELGLIENEKMRGSKYWKITIL